MPPHSRALFVRYGTSMLTKTLRLPFWQSIIWQSINKVTEQLRCPYCVTNGTFRPMTDVAEGRLICSNCGHTSFLNEKGLRCPCYKC